MTAQAKCPSNHCCLKAGLLMDEVVQVYFSASMVCQLMEGSGVSMICRTVVSHEQLAAMKDLSLKCFCSVLPLKCVSVASHDAAPPTCELIWDVHHGSMQHHCNTATLLQLNQHSQSYFTIS